MFWIVRYIDWFMAFHDASIRFAVDRITTFLGRNLLQPFLIWEEGK